MGNNLVGNMQYKACTGGSQEFTQRSQKCTRRSQYLRKQQTTLEEIDCWHIANNFSAINVNAMQSGPNNLSCVIDIEGSAITKLFHGITPSKSFLSDGLEGQLFCDEHRLIVQLTRHNILDS